MADFLTTLRGTNSPGTLAEIFSHSLTCVSAGPESLVSQAVASTWETAFTNVTTNMQQFWTSGITWTDATAAKILGYQNGDLGAAHHTPMNLPGTAPSTALPSQCAVAVSLWGGLHLNGTPVKGRFYLPAPSNALISQDGLISPVQQQNLLDMIEGWFMALATAGHTPAVWSRKDGRVQTVDRIRVGNKIDVIRSRRNAMPETYVETGFVP